MVRARDLAWVVALVLLTGCGRDRKQEAVARLMAAAAKGDTAGVAEALKARAPVDAANDSGATALMLACRHGQTAVTRMLLERKANANAADRRGRAPLHYALSPLGSDREVAQMAGLLVQAGADPNVETGPAPPLVTAAYLPTASVEVSRLLLDHGSWIDIRDAAGRSALMTAVQQDQVALVQFLLTQGADMNARDRSGRNIVSYAARKPNIMGLLFRSGAKPR